MKKAYAGGILLILFGTSIADSSNLFLPFTLIAIGIIITGAQLCLHKGR